MPGHNIHSKLTLGHFPAEWTGFYIPGHGNMEGWGATVPSDGATGWGKGARFRDTNATGDTDGVYINIGDKDSANFDVITELSLEADLALATSGNGASKIGVFDTAGYFATATAEAVLAEIGKHITSTQAFLNIPLGAFTNDIGVALAVYAAAPAAGYHAVAEGLGIQWGAHANPTPIGTSIPYPPDLDPASNIIMHFLAAKAGATIGDAVIWTVTAFENIDGALYDADSDFGGDSSAMTGDAATKTCQEETLTLAAANITGSPGCLNLTIQPKDGTLGTDDVILLGVWLEYTRKLLTA